MGRLKRQLDKVVKDVEVVVVVVVVIIIVIDNIVFCYYH